MHSHITSYLMNINTNNQNTKKSIKNINRPLSAYQYYTKDMWENWNNLSPEEREKYEARAKADKQRFNSEKEDIINKSKEEIKKLNIFLTNCNGRVPCVGLDNGFSNYEARGPVDTIELFTEEEKKKLVEKGILAKDIGKYKSVGGYKFNWRASKCWSVTVYGGNKRNSNTWWSVNENYEGKAGRYTKYHNHKGETWTTYW